MALILNKERQIIAVNSAFLSFIDVKDLNAVIGLRPGEAFSCTHRQDNPGGCGTSLACHSCGLAMALQGCDLGRTATRNECWIQYCQDNVVVCHEFEIQIVSLPLADQEFHLVTLQSLSDRKRREMMERRFFHELKNANAASIAATELLLSDITPLATETQKDVIGMIAEASQEALDSINLFCVLHAVEEGLYRPERSRFQVSTLLDSLREAAQRIHERLPKSLQIEISGNDATLEGDQKILTWTLIAALENAIEASPIEGTIRVTSEKREMQIVFTVYNQGSISPELRQRVFQRCYSSKNESGRGMGTYLMKLFTERVLKGHVSFKEDKGVSFFITLPL